jgi:uncharacterized protein
VVFDNRNFGASEGEPRQEIEPWQQIRDFRDAITWASGLPEVDAERIGCLPVVPKAFATTGSA